MNNGGCPLCTTSQANPKGSVGKSVKKMFIPMLVSYRDPNSATGYQGRYRRSAVQPGRVQPHLHDG